MYSTSTQQVQPGLDCSNDNKVFVMAGMYVNQDCYLLQVMDMIKHFLYIIN